MSIVLAYECRGKSRIEISATVMEVSVNAGFENDCPECGEIQQAQPQQTELDEKTKQPQNSVPVTANGNGAVAYQNHNGTVTSTKPSNYDDVVTDF
jgi:hypothetical protein